MGIFWELNSGSIPFSLSRLDASNPAPNFSNPCLEILKIHYFLQSCSSTSYLVHVYTNSFVDYKMK